MRNVSTQAVATATYRDTWAGDLRAFLLPQKTTRGGKRLTVYRWQSERGCVCDGLAHGTAAPRMVAHAMRHALFSDVAVNVSARAIMGANQ